MTTSAIANLPSRPRYQDAGQFKQVDLVTNYKMVTLKHSLETDMAASNRLHYLQMIQQSRLILEAEVGPNFAFSGRTIYSFKQKEGMTEKSEKTIQLDWKDSKISATLRYIKKVDLSNVYLKEAFQQPLAFMNSYFKNILRKFGYTEIGKSRKFFNIKKKEDLNDLLLYRGYETCFVPKIGGLFLQIETANRIVRKETVLNFIEDIYRSLDSKPKDEKRDIVRESLLGRSIMANYGTSMSWKIEDVVFDRTMTELKLEGETQDFNIVDYYKTRYNLIIKKPNQPLLQSTDKTNKRVFLVPELCLMTGIPQNYDQRKRMEISKMTIKDSQYRYQKIKELDQMLEQTSDPEKPSWKSFHNIGLQISDTLYTTKAEETECPELMLGENPSNKKFESVEKGRECSFQLFNKVLYKTKIELNILLIHFKFSSRDVKNVITNTSKNIGLTTTITEKDLGQFDNQNWFNMLSNTVESKKREFNMIFFILPPKCKSKYPDIKRLCYSKDDACVNSQVALETKIGNPKSMQAVTTKILLQMAVKVGNIPWVPDPPKCDKKIMLVGMSIAKIPNSKKAVVAYNSTKDKYYSKMFSSYKYQDKFDSTTIVEKAGQILLECLKAYAQHNQNAYPDVVIVMRDGCTDDQRAIIYQNQINDVLKSMEMLSQSSKLIYISIDRKPPTKFFKKMEGRYGNPNPGTFIRYDLISSEKDFFLISQQSKISSVVPTYFKTLFDNASDQGISSGFLAKLFFGQCFNYMNWTGSVKVPAQLQYACKLAKFKSEFFKEAEVNQQLEGHIYYI